jgi:secreted Zn-dependent insulinase-like peptidase
MDQFRVEISLTEKGERDYMRILELLYMFINKIKSEGIKEFVQDEYRRMSLINFDNITKTTALNYATRLCSRMSKIPFEEEIPDLLWRPYSHEQYKPEEIMKRFELLTPERSVIKFISKIVE